MPVLSKAGSLTTPHVTLSDPQCRRCDCPGPPILEAVTQSPAQREPLRTCSFYNDFTSTALDSRRGLIPWTPPHPSSDVYQMVNAGPRCCVRRAVKAGGEGGLASSGNGSATLPCPSWGRPVSFLEMVSAQLAKWPTQEEGPTEDGQRGCSGKRGRSPPKEPE